MTDSKHTKRALLSSALALVLCFAMLLGTTFAWFTDNASTSVNTITSGNLKIALEMHNGEKWVDAAGQTLGYWDNNTKKPMPGTVLWEPGCSYVMQPVHVVNQGNLALKFKIEVTGIDGDDGLNKVIDWTVTTSDQPNTCIVAGCDHKDISKCEFKLMPNKTSDTMYLCGKMDENAGNEYQSMTLSGISINVYATQWTSESDSYHNQYDKNATYDQEVYDDDVTVVSINSLDEFKAFDVAVDSNGQYKGVDVANNLKVAVELNCDIDLSSYPEFTGIGDGRGLYGNSYNGIFNGKGHTIKNWTVSQNWNLYCGFFRTVYGIRVKHVNFENFNLGVATTKGTNYGVVIGMIGDGSGNLVEDVTVKNCTIACKKHTSAIVGGMNEGGLTVKNCKAENVTIKTASDSGTGLVLGYGYSYHDKETSGMWATGNTSTNVKWYASDVEQTTIPEYNYEK